MQEFIKKLSIETPYIYEQCSLIVNVINNRVGNIETVKKIYEKDGHHVLMIYFHQIELGVVY